VPPEEILMKRTFFALLLALGVALPASADVTIKQTTGGKGLGISGKTSGTTYIKGNKMRTDVQMGDKVQSMIFDLDAQKLYMFESKKKEADVWDMAAFGAEIGQNIDTANIKASIKANGQTKQFGPHTAAGYDMEVSVPASMGGNKEQQMTITMTGPVWIVKNAPGAADYNSFYRAAAEKGWIFSDPRAAKGQPGQAKAMTEMYRQFAEIGGIAYETNLQMKMGMGGGGGPLGGFLAKLGNVEMTTMVEDVQTGPLADDLFAPPAGYKLVSKKN
jgi:hypothetical protein